MDSKLKYLYLILLIIIASASALLFYPNNHVNYTFDDLNYLHFAELMYYGKFNPLQSPYAYGYLLPLPMAISFYLFGFSLFTASLPFIIAYVLLILLIYLICLKFFSELISFSTALIASFSCLLYTSPSPRDRQKSRMPSSA